MDDFNIFLSVLIKIAGVVITFAGAVAAIAKLVSFLNKKIKKVALESKEEQIKTAVKESIEEGLNSFNSRIDVIEEQIKDLKKQLNSNKVSLDSKIQKLEDIINQMKQESEQQFAIIQNTLQDVTRQTLKEIYDEAMLNNYISEHMFYCFQQLYDDYCNKLNGNSFIMDYFIKLKELEEDSRKRDRENGLIG